jgi:hypothetical protein
MPAAAHRAWYQHRSGGLQPTDRRCVSRTCAMQGAQSQTLKALLARSPCHDSVYTHRLEQPGGEQGRLIAHACYLRTRTSMRHCQTSLVAQAAIPERGQRKQTGSIAFWVLLNCKGVRTPWQSRVRHRWGAKRETASAEWIVTRPVSWMRCLVGLWTGATYCTSCGCTTATRRFVTSHHSIAHAQPPRAVPFACRAGCVCYPHYADSFSLCGHEPGISFYH